MEKNIASNVRYAQSNINIVLNVMHGRREYAMILYEMLYMQGGNMARSKGYRPDGQGSHYDKANQTNHEILVVIYRNHLFMEFKWYWCCLVATAFY